MSGWEIDLRAFTELVEVASLHHMKQIAEPIGLTVHTRRGAIHFRDPSGVEVRLERVLALTQADPQVQRWTYNLHMYYRIHG